MKHLLFALLLISCTKSATVTEEEQPLEPKGAQVDMAYYCYDCKMKYDDGTIRYYDTCTFTPMPMPWDCRLRRDRPHCWTCDEPIGGGIIRHYDTCMYGPKPSYCDTIRPIQP